MNQQRKALGRGLSSLIPTREHKDRTEPADGEAVATSAITGEQGERQASEVARVPLEAIVPNRSQPRREFDATAIEDLANSIREHGIIQPLLVTPTNKEGTRFELIAGERRLRAAREVGLDGVPVVIRRNISSEGLLELAIIENLQREDLNPIEEAIAFGEMLETFALSHEDIGKRVGKSRAYVSNSVRLLQLPKGIQDDLTKGRLDPGHARALLALPDSQTQLTVRDQILQAKLTVRAVEKMVRSRLGRKTKQERAKTEHLTPQLRMVVEEMSRAMGTKVELRPKNSQSGALIFEYYSLQDLDRIYRKVVA
jgi:ParB family transcriptional regulator, chromosome partitioning protein